MPVDTKSPQWEDKEYSWFLTRKAIGGQSEIKRQNTLFLPIPTAMNAIQSNPSSLSNRNDNTSPGVRESLEFRSPNFHQNPAYKAYKTRAQFPDMTAKTLRGLVGIATKQMPVVELPNSMQYMIDDFATVTGLNLNDLYKLCISEVLQTGRYPICLDVDPELNRPVIITYTAESFINWESGFVNGKIDTTLAVFEESIKDPESNDRFSHDSIKSHRVLALVDGLYTSQLFIDGKERDLILPNIQGRTLDFIPKVVIGSTNLDLIPDIIPLEGIADIAVHIYMKSADIGQSEYMTANPTLVYSGIDEDDAPNTIGPTGAIVLSSPEAKAYYVETSGNGIAAQQASVQAFFEQAKEEGGALLGGTKKQAEAAETTRLRQEASGASLQTVTETAGRGIEQILKSAAIWLGEDPAKVSFEPNTEFSEHSLTAPEQTALLNSWTNNAISYETYYSNLQRAGITPEDRTAAEEQTLIDTEMPTLLTPTGGNPNAKAPSQEEETQDQGQEEETLAGNTET